VASPKHISPRIRKGAPLIVGSHPDYYTLNKNKHFAGDAGQLIVGGYDKVTGEFIPGAAEMLGYFPDECSMTYRVPSGWGGPFERLPENLIKRGADELKEVIAAAEPSVIIALGPQAAYDLVPEWATLTDRKPGDYSGGRHIKGAKEAMDRRGFIWYDDVPCPVIPTLHPASAVYSLIDRMLINIDFKRAGDVLRDKLPRQTFPRATRIRTARDMRAVWEADLVAYDIEITWGGKKFLCIGLYTDKGEAYLAYGDALKAVEPWLRSDHRKLAHNGQFDRYFLEAKMGIPVGGRHEDTIVGHWACYPEIAGKAETGGDRSGRKSGGHKTTRKGLNFLASFHLNYPWWKTYTSSPEKMGELCVNDVVATMDCWKIISEDMDHFNVREQYIRQMKKIPRLIAVQKRGFKVDSELHAERISELEARGGELYNQSRAAALEYLVAEHHTHYEDGKEYPWYHAAQCPCCNGGSICKTCNNLRDLKKPSLVLWCMRQGMSRDEATSMTTAQIKDKLHTCATCEGNKKIDSWDFNPLSSTQMPLVLWGLLGIPKGLHGKDGPDASEETMKKVFEWSKN
jgi:hypothetical protein